MFRILFLKLCSCLAPALQTVLDVCYIIPKTNIGTLVVSIVTIICLILAKELNSYLSKRIPVPIPVELLGVSTEAFEQLM